MIRRKRNINENHRFERLLTTKNEGYNLDKIIEARQILSSIKSMAYDLEENLEGVDDKRIDPAIMKLNTAIWNMISVLENCEEIAKRNDM